MNIQESQFWCLKHNVWQLGIWNIKVGVEILELRFLISPLREIWKWKHFPRCFLWYAPQQTVEQTIETPVILRRHGAHCHFIVTLYVTSTITKPQQDTRSIKWCVLVTPKTKRVGAPLSKWIEMHAWVKFNKFPRGQTFLTSSIYSFGSHQQPRKTSNSQHSSTYCFMITTPWTHNRCD